MAVSLGGGSILLIGEPEKIAVEQKPASRHNDDDDNDDNSQKTQGLVQLRVLNLDEDADIQETSCYVHEGLRDTNLSSSRDGNVTNALKNKNYGRNGISVPYL